MTSASVTAPITVALIGFGKFSRFITASLATLPAVRIVAVFDPTISLTKRPPELPPAIRVVASQEELLADPTIEAVHIATPPATHAAIALRALAAGKHVVVEKPLALTPADARRVHKASLRAERVLAVNFVLRYNPIIQIFRRLIEMKDFGALRWLHLDNVAPRVEPVTHWFWDVAQSGGIHLEHGVHFFDTAAYFLDQAPTRLTGELLFRGPRNTEAVATAVFPGNEVAHFSHGFLTDRSVGRTTWLLVWEHARAVIYGWTPLRAEIVSTASASSAGRLQELGFTVASTQSPLRAHFALPGTEDAVYGAAIRGVWDDVAAAIRDGRPLAIDGKAGELSVSLAYRASRHHVQLADV